MPTYHPTTDAEAFTHLIECWAADGHPPETVMTAHGERMPTREFLGDGPPSDEFPAIPMQMPRVYVELVCELADCDRGEAGSYTGAAHQLRKLLDTAAAAAQ